jgi:hypothetical protein
VLIYGALQFVAEGSTALGDANKFQNYLQKVFSWTVYGRTGGNEKFEWAVTYRGGWNRMGPDTLPWGTPEKCSRIFLIN